MGLFDTFRKQGGAPLKKADSAMWLAQAQSYIRLKRFTDALHCLDKAIACDKENPLAWHEKGRILALVNEEKASISCYDRAIELRPGSAVYYHNKGDALASFGRYAEADECFKKALSLSPDDVVFLTSHARMLSQAKKYREADEIMARVCDLEPRGPEHWFNLATMLYDCGKMADPVSSNNAAYTLAPGPAVSNFTCGTALSSLKKKAGADIY